DGIRDFHVTGVQTCALPIFPVFADLDVRAEREDGPQKLVSAQAELGALRSRDVLRRVDVLLAEQRAARREPPPQRCEDPAVHVESGRASWREGGDGAAEGGQ